MSQSGKWMPPVRPLDLLVANKIGSSTTIANRRGLLITNSRLNKPKPPIGTLGSPKKRSGHRTLGTHVETNYQRKSSENKKTAGEERNYRGRNPGISPSCKLAG
jgi:hypothetical protein